MSAVEFSLSSFESISSGVNHGDEKYLLGRVTNSEAIDPNVLDIHNTRHPAVIQSVEVQDPYVLRYSAMDRAQVLFLQQGASLVAQKSREAGNWQRQPGTVYVDSQGNTARKKSWGNPELTDLFFNSLASPALNIWRDLMPSAEALAYLSDPHGIDTITSKDKSKTLQIDDTARKWFTLCTDGTAIRSRATVLSELVADYAMQHMSEYGTSMNWMSVACGTALPTMQAAKKAAINGGTKLMLIDHDKQAMEMAHSLAGEIDFRGEIEKKEINIFNKSAMANLKAELDSTNTRPQVMDLMGIFEYTGSHIRVDPAEFLASCYDILQPGGRLVFGQMRHDHPVLDFTAGVVGWPFVHMRSPDEFMSIITAAGIAPKEVSLYLPKDGVYMVGAIDKPRGASTLIPAGVGKLSLNGI